MSAAPNTVSAAQKSLRVASKSVSAAQKSLRTAFQSLFAASRSLSGHPRWQAPTPNKALQRTGIGGQPSSDLFVLRRRCLSLSLSALGHLAHMPSQKHLNGLTHNILDHAVSGLSYLQPHLAQVCRAAGVSTLTLDLLSASPLPATLRSLQPAVFACEALHRTFLSITQKLGFVPQDIASASLTYEFPANCTDDYRFACTSELVGASGWRYRHSMHTDTYYTGGLTTRSSEQTTALGPHWFPSPSSP